jgi:tetrahydromethanopterin S-methyltransferase subunit G
LVPGLNAQTIRSTKQEATIQEVINRLDQLDKKFESVDNRLEKIENRLDQFDKRLYEIEKTLAVYNERFQAIQRIFSIFGFIFGFVLLIAVAIFGYYFNKLGQLIKQISSLETRYEEKKYQLTDDIITEDLLEKIRLLLKKEMLQPSKVSDEIAEYKTKK